MRAIKTLLSLLMWSLIATSAIGQSATATKVGSEMVGAWSVTVGGSNRDRVFVVENVSQKADETLSIDGKFGWPGAEQLLSFAEFNIATKELRLTAKSGAKVIATQAADGSFAGKFFDKNDQAKDLKIAKISENDLQTGRGSPRDAAPTIEKPSADVPAACAAFVGAWVGTWTNSGTTWLWVVSVGTNCVAKYSYSKNPKPRTFSTGEIKKGILEISTPFGVNYFEFRGNKLFDRFVGNGIDDTLAFAKVDLSDDSLAKLSANQKMTEGAGTNPIPPTSDVPASCAAFFGSWVGTWSYGIPEQRLRVVEVDAKCVAKYSYANSGVMSYVFKTSEIKEGILSFACNDSTGGTCVFRAQGSAIDASYSNPSGGVNSAIFKKTQ